MLSDKKLDDMYFCKDILSEPSPRIVAELIECIREEREGIRDRIEMIESNDLIIRDPLNTFMTTNTRIIQITLKTELGVLKSLEKEWL